MSDTARYEYKAIKVTRAILLAAALGAGLAACGSDDPPKIGEGVTAVDRQVCGAYTSDLSDERSTLAGAKRAGRLSVAEALDTTHYVAHHIADYPIPANLELNRLTVAALQDASDLNKQAQVMNLGETVTGERLAAAADSVSAVYDWCSENVK